MCISSFLYLYIICTQDEKLLPSSAITERVRLYDKYCGPVDQHAVKISFLNKIHRKHPPFRTKVVYPGHPTIDVPEAIKAHYKYVCVALALLLLSI